MVISHSKLAVLFQILCLNSPTRSSCPP